MGRPLFGHYSFELRDENNVPFLVRFALEQKVKWHGDHYTLEETVGIVHVIEDYHRFLHDPEYTALFDNAYADEYELTTDGQGVAAFLRRLDAIHVRINSGQTLRNNDNHIRRAFNAALSNVDWQVRTTFSKEKAFQFGIAEGDGIPQAVRDKYTQLLRSWAPFQPVEVVREGPHGTGFRFKVQLTNNSAHNEHLLKRAKEHFPKDIDGVPIYVYEHNPPRLLHS